ncbi:Thiol-disulfide isomerase or thioredoxin [Spirosoma endophyticum]|uniref:Thiol-disulfide isomerase or thioredoxin n=2 Tax=Spirosoma endophyticum TaxID=662367 RepID=A0A1I2FEW7_9BACT|nr:Thiol-disulfide isomerase or thioredoxin [Spirosoma endophyticum]
MKMSLIINILSIAFMGQLMAVSPSFSQETYRLKAAITGLSSSSVVIRYSRQGMLINDTIRVHQNQFTHALAMTDGAIATLVLNPTTQLPFWLESPLISITGTLGTTPILQSRGTPENDWLDLYRKTIERPYTLRKQGKSSAEVDAIVLQQDQATRQFIAQHPTTRTAAYLLYWQAVYDTTIFDQIELLLAKLSPQVKASYWAQKTLTRINNVQNRPRVGKKLPAFSLPDATGKTISLTSFAGKYILLDFWGTWCVPCIQGIPELKAIHEKYGSRLAIVSIALERPSDRQKWLKAIDKYDMNWTQTAQFTSAREGVNELYNIHEYPTFLLADPEGILVAKIKYGEVESQLEQLLK